MARAINSYFILTQTQDKINNQNTLTVSLLPESTPQEMSNLIGRYLGQRSLVCYYLL